MPSPHTQSDGPGDKEVARDEQPSRKNMDAHNPIKNHFGLRNRLSQFDLRQVTLPDRTVLGTLRVQDFEQLGLPSVNAQTFLRLPQVNELQDLKQL